MNKLKQHDPDFYFEHIYENEDENHDMAKNRSKLKPEEVIELKKSHDYWENARLKACVICNVKYTIKSEEKCATI